MTTMSSRRNRRERERQERARLAKNVEQARAHSCQSDHNNQHQQSVEGTTGEISEAASSGSETRVDVSGQQRITDNSGSGSEAIESSAVASEIDNGRLAGAVVPANSNSTAQMQTATGINSSINSPNYQRSTASDVSSPANKEVDCDSISGHVAQRSDWYDVSRAVHKWNFGEFFPIDLTVEEIRQIRDKRNLKPVELCVAFCLDFMESDDPARQLAGMRLLSILHSKNLALANAKARREDMAVRTSRIPENCLPPTVAVPIPIVATEQPSNNSSNVEIEWIPRLPYNGRGPKR